MAAHKLPRLSKAILDKPQLITAEKFQEVAEVLENRSEYLKAYKEELFVDLEGSTSSDLDEFLSDDIGVLRVEGPTTYKPTGWEALCGGTSYTDLLSDMKAFVEEGKKTVLMRVDSPGGQAYRMMFTAKELRRLADENGIKLIAYVDGMAASAGMGLTAAAHEIIANPESEVGSIGVVVSLLCQKKAMEDAGLKRVFITAGQEKVPFDEEGNFKDTFLEGIQEDVDTLYEKFVAHVASLTGASEEAIRKTEAKLLKADKALEIGLVDKLMEETEFIEYLAELSCGKDKHKETKTIPLKENLMSESFDMAEFEAMKAELAALKAEKELAAVEAQKAELTESLATAPFLSDVEGVVDFLMNADASQATLFNTVLTDAQAALEAQEAKASASLSEATEKFNKELSDKQAEMEAAVETHEAAMAELKESLGKAQEEASIAKEEFAAPTCIEGDNTSIQDNEADVQKSTALADFIKQKHNL